MATYQLPVEPEVDVIWTTHSEGASQPVETQRWNRTPGGWFRPDLGADRNWTWAEVLGLGHAVHDTHPELGDCSPLPWTLDWDVTGAVLEDGDGDPVRLDEANASLIVRAVNAYAAHIQAGA